MKKSFLSILICLLIAQAAIAQKVVVKGRSTVRSNTAITATYSLDALTGKWQEVKRTSSSGRRTTFADSLQINFNKRDSVIVRDGITMSQQGFAEVVNDKLIIAGDTYDINSLNDNKLVISDGIYTRELVRKKSYYYESLGKIMINKDNLSNPINADSKKLNGKWYVYRTQATPGVAADSAIIKNIAFNRSRKGLGGEITFTKGGTTQTIPFTATYIRSTLLISSPTETWDVQTFKADGKEFIFGNEGGLVYFAKQLR